MINKQHWYICHIYTGIITYWFFNNFVSNEEIRFTTKDTHRMDYWVDCINTAMRLLRATPVMHWWCLGSLTNRTKAGGTIFSDNIAMHAWS